MLSTQSTLSKLQMPGPEPPRSARLNPQTPSFVPSSPMRGPSTTTEAQFDNWLHEFAQHQGTLQAMAEASLDAKFQEELGTIEQWFKVLSEAERTASIYALVQHSSQNQIRFFIAVLQQMVRAAEGPNSAVPSEPTNNNPRSLRPASLNLPTPRTPATPQFSAGPDSATFGSPDSGKPKPNKLGGIAEEGDPVLMSAGLSLNSSHDWASMVNTPLGNMFPKRALQSAGLRSAGLPSNPNLEAGMINGFNNMNMMGVSQEAQLLAMQLVMSGMVQPGIQMPQQNGKANNQRAAKPAANTGGANNWRGPGVQGQATQGQAQTQRFPRSALKSPAVKSPVSGGKSATTSTPTAAKATPANAPGVGAGSRPDDEVDPELLKDVAAWLKSLRLHKYTPSFEGMTWEQMVALDDAALEKKGVSALGARRRLLRTFENVRKRMGLEPLESTEGNGVDSKPAAAAPVAE